MWENNIKIISETAGNYPKESYAAVVRAIQSEQIFLQRVTWDTEDTFSGVEKIICETFLPRIFFVNTKTLFPVVGALSTMRVKKFGLGILNPVTSYQEKYLSSTRGRAELVRSVTGGWGLSNANHLRTLSEERRDRKKSRDVAYKSRLKFLVINLQGTDKHLLLRAKITGAWLSLRSTTVSGTVLSATSFWGFYVLAITSLP